MRIETRKRTPEEQKTFVDGLTVGVNMVLAALKFDGHDHAYDMLREQYRDKELGCGFRLILSPHLTKAESQEEMKKYACEAQTDRAPGSEPEGR